MAVFQSGIRSIVIGNTKTEGSEKRTDELRNGFIWPRELRPAVYWKAVSTLAYLTASNHEN